MSVIFGPQISLRHQITYIATCIQPYTFLNYWLRVKQMRQNYIYILSISYDIFVVSMMHLVTHSLTDLYIHKKHVEYIRTLEIRNARCSARCCMRIIEGTHNRVVEGRGYFYTMEWGFEWVISLMSEKRYTFSMITDLEENIVFFLLQQWTLFNFTIKHKCLPII